MHLASLRYAGGKELVYVSEVRPLTGPEQTSDTDNHYYSDCLVTDVLSNTRPLHAYPLQCYYNFVIKQVPPCSVAVY